MAAARPTTSASRPYTATTEDRPGTSWTTSEAPSSSHGPASYAYPTQYYDQHRNLYVQGEEIEEEEEEESEDEDVFAYLPPTTAQKEEEQRQLDRSNAAPDSSTQLQGLAAAAGLAESKPIPPAPVNPGPRYVETPPQTNSTVTYDDLETGPNSFHMRALPSSANSIPGTKPATTTSREVRVTLPSTSSSSAGPLPHKRASGSEADTSVLDIHSSLKYADVELDDEDDSPYPEVRASVSNIDDPDMPALTFRMWFIGLVFCFISSGANIFFSFRQPAPYILPIVALLLGYPAGRFLAYVLPIRTWRLPSKLGGTEFSLNPGPFNIKEHVLIYIMANIATGPAYAMHAIVVSEKFYDLHLGVGFDFTLILATQLTGFGLAGLCRRFLVWPASMIWPLNLVVCTLLNTLHADEDETAGGISRYRFFLWVATGAFFWNFFPGFLFQALSIFSWVCWIAPQNIKINQLFGSYSGLGMGFLTFDWSQIAWIGSPLMVPWWAQVHIFAGFALFYWIIAPIIYYTNSWHLAHFPILSSFPWDRFGQRYNISRVMTQNMLLNVTAFQEYSPLYLPTSYALVYLLAFAMSTCILVHTALYHGKSLYKGFKKIQIEEDDVHAKLMRHYPEVPDWWYATFMGVFFIIGVVAIEVWPTGIPVWALALAVVLPSIYILPSGFIYAVTGQAPSINLIAEIVPGTLLPGNPLANMVFKAYSVQTLSAGLSFVQDLKLGHYLKVPPRAVFSVQAVSTIIAAFVQVGVKEWLVANVSDFCEPTQKDKLTCPQNRVFFTSSVVWGLIGPTRQFGKDSIYNFHVWALLIGAFLPVPFWLWQRRYPKTKLKHINMPVLLNGPAFIPPASGINYSSWFLFGFVFQFLIRRRNFRWWVRFNYILSASLDSGTTLSILFIFFTLQWPNGGVHLNWWGNEVFTRTLDATPRALLPTPPEGFA